MKDKDPWQKFKANPSPLAKIREVKLALPNGPGLPALYQEAKEHGTLMGVPILAVSRNIFVSRQRIIAVVEGAK